MRTAHVKANGRKIAVSFLPPVSAAVKVSKETQTRIVELSKNETFVIDIPTATNPGEEVPHGFEEVDISEIVDDNLNSYLDVDLEYLESLSSGSDHVTILRPSPFPLTLPPVDQSLSLSSVEGVISCCGDSDVAFEDINEQCRLLEADSEVSFSNCSDSTTAIEAESEDDQTELEDQAEHERIYPDEAESDCISPRDTKSSEHHSMKSTVAAADSNKGETKSSEIAADSNTIETKSSEIAADSNTDETKSCEIAADSYTDETKSSEMAADSTDPSDLNSVTDLSTLECDESDSGFPCDYTRYFLAMNQLHMSSIFVQFSLNSGI